MTKKAKSKLGSSFDSFLKEEGRFEAIQAVAIKRVLAIEREWDVLVCMIFLSILVRSFQEYGCCSRALV